MSNNINHVKRENGLFFSTFKKEEYCTVNLTKPTVNQTSFLSMYHV